MSYVIEIDDLSKRIIYPPRGMEFEAVANGDCRCRGGPGRSATAAKAALGAEGTKFLTQEDGDRLRLRCATARREDACPTIYENVSLLHCSILRPHAAHERSRGLSKYREWVAGGESREGVADCGRGRCEFGDGEAGD